MSNELDRLYQDAKTALAKKDYDSAADLFRQILMADHDYRDAAQLLARTVKLSRRHWYNDPRVWGVIGILLVVALLAVFVPKIQLPVATPVKPPSSPTLTLEPTITLTPFPTLTPSPTPIPLVWKRISLGQEFPRDLIKNIFIDPKDADIVYASMEHAGIYKTLNGGLSWGPVQTNSIDSYVTEALLNFKEKNSYVNIAQDGVKRIYKYDGYWYVSENSGKSWRRFSGGGTYRSNTITFDTSGALFIFCGDSICKFSPDGRQLTKLGNPQVGIDKIITHSPHNQNTLYAAGEGLSVSRDKGATWSQIHNGLGGTILQLMIQEPSTLYLLVGKCNRNRSGSTMEQPLYRSMDGGLSWEYIDKQGCFFIKGADKNLSYRLATDTDNYNPWVWQISNRGKRWDKIFIPSAVTTLIAHPTRPGVLYAYDHQNTSINYYYSENYGLNWEIDTSPEVKSCYGITDYYLNYYKPMALDPQDSNHVLFAENNYLLESFTGCADSTKTIKYFNDNINAVAIDSNNSRYFVGTDKGAQISFDNGKTWNEINEGLLGANIVYSIVVDPESNVYATTPYGIFKLESK